MMNSECLPAGIVADAPPDVFACNYYKGMVLHPDRILTYESSAVRLSKQEALLINELFNRGNSIVPYKDLIEVGLKHGYSWDYKPEDSLKNLVFLTRSRLRKAGINHIAITTVDKVGYRLTRSVNP